MIATRRNRTVGIWIPAVVLALPFCIMGGPTAAGPMQPTGPVGTGITILIPAGTNNAPGSGLSKGNPFTDDVYLSTITFPGGMLVAATGVDPLVLKERYKPALEALVLDGGGYSAGAVNAEFGDNDNNADSDPNPFVKVGVAAEGQDIWTSNTDPIRESTNPGTQNAAIAAAFGVPSLLQGVDGEASDSVPPAAGEYKFRLFLTAPIRDNDAAFDYLPEVVAFERGINSDFALRAILDGSKIDNPVYAPDTVTVLRTDMLASGIWIDTVEINRPRQNNPPQQLGVIGIDLSDFGVLAGQSVIGFEITSLNDSGPDLYGLAFFDNGDDGNVPEPASLGLVTGGVVALLARGRRRRK